MLSLETIEYTRNRINGLLASNKFRQDVAQQEFDRCMTEGRWSQLSGYDGMKTGLIIAEAQLRDELKELDRFAAAVIATKS